MERFIASFWRSSTGAAKEEEATERKEDDAVDDDADDDEAEEDDVKLPPTANLSIILACLSIVSA